MTDVRGAGLLAAIAEAGTGGAREWRQQQAEEARIRLAFVAGLVQILDTEQEQ